MITIVFSEARLHSDPTQHKKGDSDENYYLFGVYGGFLFWPASHPEKNRPEGVPHRDHLGARHNSDVRCRRNCCLGEGIRQKTVMASDEERVDAYWPAGSFCLWRLGLHARRIRGQGIPCHRIDK